MADVSSPPDGFSEQEWDLVLEFLGEYSDARLEGKTVSKVAFASQIGAFKLRTKFLQLATLDEEITG